MVTPKSDSTLPLSTCPAIFAGGETSRKSSITNTTNMTAAARRRPTASELSTNISWNCGTSVATAIATRKPTNIAAPPRYGIGFACMLRGPGIAMAPDARRDPAHREGQEERDPRRDAPDEQIPTQTMRSFAASRDTRLADAHSLASNLRSLRSLRLPRAPST